MDAKLKRYRVAADFSEVERDALDALCFSDFRPPGEQLRFLVMQEAKRRGLAGQPDAKPETKHNRAVAAYQGEHGAVVATQ